MWMEQTIRIRRLTNNSKKELIWGLLNRKGNTPSVLGTMNAGCKTPALVHCLACALFAQDGTEGDGKR